jgi:hypothetical protein
LIVNIARIDRQDQARLNMSDDVTFLRTITTLDLPAEKVIDGLVKNKDQFKKILVLGLDTNNDLVSFSNTSDIGLMLELMEHFKHNLFNGEYGE